jgi:hypothetical protein
MWKTDFEAGTSNRLPNPVEKEKKCGRSYGSALLNLAGKSIIPLRCLFELLASL